MRTPVSAARQCLTNEAASALDDAVAVARRRGHAQTTSMHMVSSLLSLPNSSLRESCTRARNNAYPTRVQFKALELSLGVALDRLPSSQSSKLEEPPVSNSLMAAIKRSQANQRRQPENFSYYQQQQQQYSSCSSVPIVKVELQNLILSILDDPLVSRVFGEAGFRSFDIKAATLQPGNSFHAPHLFGYSSRYKRPNPPLFLCNLRSGDSFNEVGGKGLNFPFMGYFSRDENSRRIGEFMVRGKKRNPLLLGVSSGDALNSFYEIVQRKIDGILPSGLSGLSVICVKDDILRFVNGDCDEGSLKMRIEEVQRMVENVIGQGVIVNYGDLKAFTGEGVSVDGLRYLVNKLTGLLHIYAGKLWLIGSASTHDLYYQFLNKFPSIEEDWDLQILPITSIAFSMGGSYPRSSLMESFVPLGGFFSMPSDVKSPLSNSCHYVVRCHLCNEKCEQEVKALSNSGVSVPVGENSQASLPSWLQNATEPSSESGLSTIKTKDNSSLLNVKIAGLQKKWDAICQHHHFSQSFPKVYADPSTYPFPRVAGFQVTESGKETGLSGSGNLSNISLPDQGSKNVNSGLSPDLQQISSSEVPDSQLLSKANNLNSLTNSANNLSKSEGMTVAPKSRGFDATSASSIVCQPSPASVTSVTTKLGLGFVPTPNKKFEKPIDRDVFNQRLSECPFQHPSSFSQIIPQRYKVNDPKLLYKFIYERLRSQEEAICSVVDALTRCHTRPIGVHGSSLWLNFRGPDRLSKRKLGMALAEILHGSIESFIYVDLRFQDDITHSASFGNLPITNQYNMSMRGTVVDYLVEKLSRKPSVVYLENFDRADAVVQNCLLDAIKTGRFMDLSGREANISTSIFLAVTSSMEYANNSVGDVMVNFSETEILKVKCHQIQILIGFDLNDDLSDNLSQLDTGKNGGSDLISMNKRKLTYNAKGRSPEWSETMDVSRKAHKSGSSCLDLNLPADGSETCNTGGDSDSSSENPRSWLEDFYSLTDQVVVFNPFDFKALEDKLIKDMSKCLYSIVGSKCSLEVESTVIQQLLASAYLSENKVVNWIQQVLKKGFLDAVGKYSINSCSVVKLISSESLLTEDQQFGLLLPAIIALN